MTFANRLLDDWNGTQSETQSGSDSGATSNHVARKQSRMRIPRTGPLRIQRFTLGALYPLSVRNFAHVRAADARNNCQSHLISREKIRTVKPGVNSASPRVVHRATGAKCPPIGRGRAIVSKRARKKKQIFKRLPPLRLLASLRSLFRSIQSVHSRVQ